MTMLGEASRVVPDDVFAKTRDGRQARRDRDVVAARPLDRFLAAGDRHPYRRMRRLRGPGPDGDVAIRPEPALVGEDLFGPRPANDLPGLLEACARVGQRDLVDVVLARNAAGESGNDAPAGHAVEHRQLLGEAQRVVEREQVAVDQELESLGSLRGRGGQEVGRVHQPVRRGVMLVETDAVVAEPVHGLPGREMLGIGAHGHLGLEVPPWEGPRKLLAVLEMVEVLGVGKEIEDEDPHGRQVCYKPGPSARPRPAIIQEERSSPWPPTPRTRWTSSLPTLAPRSRR